jgi:2-keto-4-pentenoate hydratase/2-oxohepta-3-ene-1,7-dioic acid hydratase in catechol pathway
LRIARIADFDRKGSKGPSNTYAIVDGHGNAITADEIISQTSRLIPSDLEDFLFTGPVEWVSRVVETLQLKHDIRQFKLLPPIQRTFKVICLAFNYSDQATWLRFGRAPPKDPVIYMKARTSLAGPYDDIICPYFVGQLDYEGELALVISKNCKNVDTDSALDYVGGYFILNDVSARDIQFVDKQYSRAKSFDTFGPCGPWLITPDEISNPNNLRLITRVNDEIRQNSCTSNMVLNIETIIQKLSKVMTLETGDIISTGTPTGTALSLSTNVKYLQHGDTVEVEIEQIGKIRNRVLFVN